MWKYVETERCVINDHEDLEISGSCAIKVTMSTYVHRAFTPIDDFSGVRYWLQEHILFK